MSTIAHPRSVPSGPSGKTVAGFVVGAVLAVAVGYGLVTVGEPVSGQLSQPAGSGADRVITQKAAELAAAKAAAVARGEHMQAINELGFGEPAANGADQLFIQRAAELAAEQAAVARTERMLEINEIWPEESPSAGADRILTQRVEEFLSQRETTLIEATKGVVLGETFGGDAAWDSRAEFLRIQHATQAQSAQWDSMIEYLGKQWNAQNGVLYGADQLFIQRAAELAAEQAALARTERMLEINELGYGASISGGADQVYKQKGADLASSEEARRRGERMFEINSFGWEPAKLESGGPKSPLTVE